MKIIYFYLDLPDMMHRWQHYHIVEELAMHDCLVEIFDISSFETKEESILRLLELMRSNHYDLFMTPYGSDFIDEYALNEIGKIGVPRLLICFDNLVNPYMHKDNCQFFDLVWLTSRENKDMFLNWGAKKVIVQPYAANPNIFKYIKSKEKMECAFLGTPYGSRVNIINSLTKNEVPVVLFSNICNSNEKKDTNQSISMICNTALRYMTYKTGRKLLNAALLQRINKKSSLCFDTSYLSLLPPVDIAEQYKVYSSYALSLSSTTARNTGVLKDPVSIVNLRSFEIPMSGGIQFCRYNNELSNYFEDKKEIIFYNNDDEMISLAKYYLKDENKYLRDNIRAMARIRAESEHTWWNRFTNVFDSLGICY